MTREEAIQWLEETLQDTDTYWDSCSDALQKELDEQKEVFLLALSALRPITKEQVEKMWRGEWIRGEYACGEHEWECSKCHGTEWRTSCSRLKFCPFCGAPMTDEAVQMVMERLEALYGEEN